MMNFRCISICRCLLIGGPGHGKTVNVENLQSTVLYPVDSDNDVLYHRAYWQAADEMSVVYALAGMSTEDIEKSILSLPADIFADFFMATNDPSVVPVDIKIDDIG